MLMLTDDGAFAENLRNPEVCPIESVYQVKVYARDEKGMTGWLPVVGMTKSSRRQESFFDRVAAEGLALPECAQCRQNGVHAGGVSDQSDGEEHGQMQERCAVIISPVVGMTNVIP